MADDGPLSVDAPGDATAAIEAPAAATTEAEASVDAAVDAETTVDAAADGETPADAAPDAERPADALVDDEAPADAVPDAPDACEDGAEALSGSYDAASLARPLGDWEISRDHLVFVDIAGLDTTKRSALQVLEPPSASGKHGGVLLAAVGNTAQLLTLSPLTAPGERPTVQARRFLFGSSGGGVGCLAVHPSGSFFAVGEKGVKPRIVIYSYPAPVRAARVLRNGTERAYASVCFSGRDAQGGAGGDKLASVGAAPDFLLTVWDWRREATILRCKAFGQEVFRVQFAPADSGFLATSGVGHVRMWKMAATFTGLKLQGDIGKFGKSELSDIDAFCVLPDKKVLSGTERGVLLLWEGNFIKCEILTARRHAPHAGPVRVVELDRARARVVTAGADGFVRFWSLETIDAADVPPDDSVALIPMQRQVLVAPHMDIRAVVALGDDAAADDPQRFLVQDAAGGVHLLSLVDGEKHVVDLDVLANATGRATGVACSPYEHLAATCGADGSVRAWDYVSQRCLLSATPVEPTGEAQSASAAAATKSSSSNASAIASAISSAASGKSKAATAASTICWVPDAAALLPAPRDGSGGQTHSRQVLVGYDDGLVRVFQTDLPRRALVRTNAFKPHSARVTSASFSPAAGGGGGGGGGGGSGGASVKLATSSADGTVFFFQVVPNARSSKIAAYPPEYVPLGFQRAPDAVRAVCWRADGAAVLATLASGRVLEFLLPAGGLSALGESGAASADGERETFELALAAREWAAPLERRRFLSSRELAALESAGPAGGALVDAAARLDFHAQRSAPTPRALAALYAGGSGDAIWLSCVSAPPSLRDLDAQSQAKREGEREGERDGGAEGEGEAGRPGALLVVQRERPAPLLECAMGETHLEDGTPTAAALGDARVVSLARSSSARFLLCGLSTGAFQLRSALHPSAFLTGAFHDAAAAAAAATAADGLDLGPSLGPSLALSFDDSFVLAAGGDGNLSVSRLHADKLADAARRLADAAESLRGQAAVAADQARDRQAAANQKAVADAQADGDGAGAAASAAGGELAAAPGFQAAKARARLVEARLAGAADAPSVAADCEAFGGVVRLASDANSTLGLPAAAGCALAGLDEPAGEAVGLPPSVIEAPEVENPREAYTIEDAKRKSEADARARAARSKQDQTREVLAQMRQQLRRLQEQDAALPAESRVDADEWDVDLDYGELLVAKGDAACDEVRRELAHAVEKQELLLLKLREAFVGPLAVELVTVRAFRGALAVQTFRTLKMQPALQRLLADLHDAAKGDAAKGDAAKGDAGPARRANASVTVPVAATVAVAAKRLSAAAVDVSALQAGAAPPPPERSPERRARPAAARAPSVLRIMTQRDLALDGDFPLKDEERRLLGRVGPAEARAGAVAAPGAPSTLAQAADAAATDSSASVHGFEARKRLRAERKARLAQWLAAKPGEDADDPRDLVAIAFAQRNMGDYKLKTAADYVVPEAQRVNAAKKLRQLARLEESLYAARLQFNAKVLELRELKARLADALARDHARLELLYASLGAAAPAVPSNLLRVDLREWPEQRERVTDADLQLYLREKKVLPHTAAAAESGGDGDGDGDREADGEDVVTLRHLPVPLHGCESPELAPSATVATARGGAGAEDAEVRTYLARVEIRSLERRRAAEVAAFDEAVALLRREKMRLDVVFKTTELRLFTLHSELELLEQFESKENLLSAKLERIKADKAQVVGDLEDVQQQTAAKKREQEECAQQEKAVHAEFAALVNGATVGGSGAPHPSFAALQKVFKRRIKRAKKRGAGGKDGDGESPDGGGKDGEQDREEEEEEEEDDDDDDYDENDDDDDDDDEEDACPPGCDFGLYEKVLALREKRADVDEAASDVTKTLEELRKSLERQSGKQRQVDKELAATEQETQVFQSEKQRRFNELDVVVALSLRQVRCLVHSSAGWAAPEQAGDCLVFSTRAFAALTERIDGLQRENRSLRQQFRDLHRQQSVLARDKRAQQETIAQVAQRCDQLQLLKFGRIVDMDMLDKASDTSALRELQDKVRVKEVEAEREAMVGRQEEQELQRELLRATEENTALLSNMAALSARQLALERELNEGGAAAARGLQDDAATQQQLEQEMRERNKLVKLVKLQARELEALKQEIGLLRGKDGKVYAPRT